MSTLKQLAEAVENGQRNDAKLRTQTLRAEGRKSLEIIEQGLVPGVAGIGEKFNNNEVFVPEMRIAARAMPEAMPLLEPLLAPAGIKPKVPAVIGPVQGDQHDIGKNLVAMRLKGANFGVVEVGPNVPPEQFATAAKEPNAAVGALSALLTTTMPALKAAVLALRAAGSTTVKIIIGGGPVTPGFASEIGRRRLPSRCGQRGGPRPATRRGPASSMRPLREYQQ